MIPLIPLPYKLLALGLWSVFLVYGGWHEATIRQQAKERNTAIAYAEQIKIEQERGDKIALELDIEKTRQKVVYRTITKEVPNYVTPLSDSRCVIPVGFIWLHNDSAAGRLPKASGDFADTPASVTLSTVGSTIADNYATCNEIKNQLNALIDWHISN